MDEKRGNVAEKLEKRLQFWDGNCVHDWYLTFTQLVAANQFAMIGLVLMAAVARVCKTTGITDLYEEIGSEHMQIVLKTMNNGTVLQEFGALDAEGQCDDDEDLGEVIERDD
jgi:ribonuclease MRP protein subunit RMP1